MKYVLYRTETYGIKNLKDKIVIDFQKMTVNKNNEISRIKSIYGTNGTGKSAIIDAIYIYKRLVTNQYFLTQSNYQDILSKMINFITNEFYISFTYRVTDTNQIFKHEIYIKKVNNVPYILKEELSILKNQTINGEFKTIYKVENGNLLITYNIDKDFEKKLNTKNKNELKLSSLISILFNEISYFNFNNNALKEIIINCYLFANNLTVYLENNNLNDFDNYINNYKYLSNKFFNKFENKLDINDHEDIILKEDINLYEKKVKKLLQFLKVFKKDLVDIKIEKKEENEFYYCYKKLIYKNYEVDSYYESTGIKQLINIFQALEDVTKDKIVFIDELDANINGVYLSMLIEYLNKSKKGQLCFTIHNLYPMKILSKLNNSIDFIGENGIYTSWKKNGNYKPYNLYPEGMIEDCLFNIDSFDFIKVFESDN